MDDVVKLVLESQKGNKDAFYQLLKRYQTAIFTISKSIMDDYHLAKDISQETFLKAYQNIHSLKDPNKFWPWLKTIAIHCCYDAFPDIKNNEEMENEMRNITITHDSLSVAKALEDKELKEVLKKSIKLLPPQERICIALQTYDNYSYGEIAHTLNISVETVKSNLADGREKLRYYLIRYQKGE